MNTHSKTSKGFTYIELFIVLGILVVLIALFIPAYKDYISMKEQIVQSEFFTKYLTNTSIDFESKYKVNNFEGSEFKRFPTQLTTQSYYGTIEYLQPSSVEEIIEKLPLAFSHFGVPETMEIDETKDVYLAIAVQDEADLADIYPHVPIADSARIKVASAVEAILSSPDFDIVSNTNETQVLRGSGVTIWSWKITPRSDGVKSISLFVSALIPVGPNRAPLAISTYERNVIVEVGYFAKLITTANNNAGLIGWLTFIGAVLLGIWKSISWLRNKFSNNKAVTPPE